MYQFYKHIFIHIADLIVSKQDIKSKLYAFDYSITQVGDPYYVNYWEACVLISLFSQLS